jgi:subtilisin family serine protease
MKQDSPVPQRDLLVMNALEQVKLAPLMERTTGRSEIVIALIDGPALMEDPALWGNNVRRFDGKLPATCVHAISTACMHGTSVASILAAKRGSGALGICPDCTLLVLPIFTESEQHHGQMPSATPDELAAAIIDAANYGVSVLNLSVSFAGPSAAGQRHLEQALDYAAARDVVTVVAAGNLSMIGGSALTSHPWAIPVTACDDSGRVMAGSNLSASIGKHGLSAPGANIPVIGADGSLSRISGTSAAAPFVAGAAALLRSVFPRATASSVKFALTQRIPGERPSLVPRLLNASAAYQILAAAA